MFVADAQSSLVFVVFSTVFGPFSVIILVFSVRLGAVILSIVAPLSCRVFQVFLWNLIKQDIENSAASLVNGLVS